MQKDQSDLGLIFKKRARRRLVGAIALVLLMVVFLPILLEDRAETGAQQEIAIVMPGNSPSDEVIISEEIINVEDLQPEKTDKVETLILPKAKPVKPKAKAPEVKKAEVKVTQVEKPKPVAEVKPKPVVKVKPKAAVEEKPKATPEKKKVVKKVVVKEPAKKVDSTKLSNPYYVQIGVFSDVANVNKLKVKLDELGYQSVTEKMKTATGDKTRLRTVSFDGRNEAAIALENIKDAGLTGMVVSQK